MLALGDTVQAGWSASGGGWINGADAIATRAVIYSLLSIVFAAGVVGEAMYRDRARSTRGLILMTGAAPWCVSLARFVVCAAIVIFAGALFVPGIALGTLAPGIQQDFVGPTDARHFGSAIALFIAPNFFSMAALSFAASVRTQSMAAAYAAGVAFVSVWIAIRMLLGQDVLRHDMFAAAALIDPFGSIAAAEFTMGRTVAENNEFFPPLAGLLLVNRLIWCCVAIGLVTFGLICAPTREELSRDRRRNQRATRAQRPLRRRLAFALPSNVNAIRVAAWEIGAAARNPGVPVVLLLLIVSLWIAAASAVTHQFSLPSTDLLVHNTGFYFDKILVLIVVWTAGELIWRERAQGLHEIMDVLPVGDASRYAGKLLALAAIVLSVWGLSIIVNLLYQLFSGYYDFEVGLHLVDTFVFRAPYYIFLGVLALTLQAVVRQRVVAMGLVLAVYLSEILLDAIGVYHPMFRYGRSTFFWYSLMDGYGHFWPPHLWMVLYWSLGAAVIGVLGWCALPRGENPPARRTLVMTRLRHRGAYLLLAGLATCFVVCGGWIRYQTTVRAPWPLIDADRLKAEVERTFGEQWRGVRAPRIVEIAGELDLFPLRERRGFEFRGVLTLHNPHDTPVERMLVLAEPWLSVEKLMVDGASVESTDDRLNARVFRFEPPLAPYDETLLSFTTSWSSPAGFTVHAENDGIPQVAPVEVIGNGTSLLNLQIMPAVGYTDRVEHKPAWKRRKFGLPPEWIGPDGPDARAQAHATFHLDWVRRVEVTIRTAEDQRVYHAGRLVDEWTEPDGRNGFRYVIDRPSRGWATIVSGRLTESRFERTGLPDLVMAHDPRHTHALEPFAAALHDAMEHFQARYGPAPFHEFVMAEQSLHFDGMGTRSGMGFASEVLGWKSDVRASGGEDLHEMAAHLMGMTWFGDQIIPANTPGAKVIHAGLPYWSAQLYLHQRRSPEVDLRRRRQHLIEAFRGRSGLIDVESPYADEFKDSTMLRAKGSGQILHLASLIGGGHEMEAIFATFLERWRYVGAPYPEAEDFIAHLREAIPPQHHELLTDVFEHVTTWDLSVARAEAEPLDDGSWLLNAEFKIRQQRTTGWGEHHEVPSTAPVELMAYSATSAGPLKPVHRDVRLLPNGTHRVSWVLDVEPTQVAIDPRLLLPDPNPYDNARRVISKPISPR